MAYAFYVWQFPAFKNINSRKMKLFPKSMKYEIKINIKIALKRYVCPLTYKYTQSIIRVSD